MSATPLYPFTHCTIANVDPASFALDYQFATPEAAKNFQARLESTIDMAKTAGKLAQVTCTACQYGATSTLHAVVGSDPDSWTPLTRMELGRLAIELGEKDFFPRNLQVALTRSLNQRASGSNQGRG